MGTPKNSGKVQIDNDLDNGVGEAGGTGDEAPAIEIAEAQVNDCGISWDDLKQKIFILSRENQISTVWHPQALGEIVPLWNGSNARAQVGELGYQLSNGTCVAL